MSSHNLTLFPCDEIYRPYYEERYAKTMELADAYSCTVDCRWSVAALDNIAPGMFKLLTEGSDEHIPVEARAEVGGGSR